MNNCKQCLMPGGYPGANIDHTGVCLACREWNPNKIDAEAGERERYKRDLENTISSIRGKGKYDCMVALSGGKDSVYLLYTMKVVYDLRVLAFMTDVNITDIARENINRTITKLNVDLITYRPPQDFYKKMFRYLLTHQSQEGAVKSVCYVCAPLYEGYAINVAIEKNIPVIFAGYSPGQPDPNRMKYEFSRKMIAETDWTPPPIRESGLFSEAELSLFWNPFRYPKGTGFPRYIAPFHALDYNQTDVINKVVELGLIQSSKKANPIHSNCPLNWLLMYSDLKFLGYNPYAPEFSDLIRRGKASRLYWRIMTPVVNFMIRHKILLGKNVQTNMKWLGLKPGDLKIVEANKG